MNNLQSIILLLASVVLFSCKTQKTAMTNLPTVKDDRQKVVETINPNVIKGHIHFLASDEMAGRDTPSEELNIAARYLATSLQRYGVQPVPGQDGYFQHVPMKNISPASTGTLRAGDSSFKLPDDFLLLTSDNVDLEKPVVFLNYGTEEDFKNTDVKDKIVVTLAGFEGQANPQEWFYAGRDKQGFAKDAGAVGMIEIYASTQIPWNFLVQFLNTPRTVVDNTDGEKRMPYMWVNAGDATAIKNLKTAQTASVQVDGIQVKKITTYNVVGYLEGSDPALKDEYVIYSAHYDHVGIGAEVAGDTIYNGARDNAVGSVTVLSAAENIAKYPTKRSALFIFFTGEEKGLLGSDYYADNPLLPLNKALYCFNSDNAGYNDTTKITVFGLTRTLAQPLMEQAGAAFGLQVIEDNMPEQNLFDRSDNVNFAAKGVPAPTFSMGITAFDDVVNRYYHQPADGPETLDYDYLEKFFKAYVYACRLIANSNQSVFWKAGDKYYEVGKKLYGK